MESSSKDRAVGVSIMEMSVGLDSEKRPMRDAKKLVKESPVKPPKEVQFADTPTANTQDERTNKTSLFCARAFHTSRTSNSLGGKWFSSSRDVVDFIEDAIDEKNQKPSFTLIAGKGNGTLMPLSVETDNFRRITSTFHLHNKIEEVIPSIHGVIARFTEIENGKKVLHILFSTPKAPVREIFCAMRINLTDSSAPSTTCLLFDNDQSENLEDLNRLLQNIQGNSREKPAWHSPVAFLAALVKECGRTSESKREDLDVKILGAEVQTKSTPWNDPARTLIQWPNDFLKTINILHLCHNSLTFVDHAVGFETNVWEFLLQLVQGEDKGLRDWRTALGADTDDVHGQANLDNILFEAGYTKNRKAQIACLKDRIKVQMDLVSTHFIAFWNGKGLISLWIQNLIAHKEASQSKMISIIALVFAPASLIVSIFSMPIFGLGASAIRPFIETFISVTLITLSVGIIFLEKQKLWQIKQAVTKFFFDKPKSREKTRANDQQ